MLKHYDEVFQDELGNMKTIKAKLRLKENATPKFYRPRRVPFALKEAVGQELNRIEEKGILKRVKHSDWAAPIVPSLRKMERFECVGITK